MFSLCPINSWLIFHTRISSMAGMVIHSFMFYFWHLLNLLTSLFILFFFSWCMGSGQAKMGMTEDFEASLQVLRGYDTDITAEVNEIKVSSWTMSIFFGNLNQLGHRTSTLQTESWFMLIFRPFQSIITNYHFIGVLSTESCCIFKQKNNNSVCRSQAKKILVSFDGRWFVWNFVFLPLQP